MRNLEDMSLGRRVIATVIIVVVIMLILACIGYLSGRWEEAQAQVAPSKWDGRMIELDKQALDQAYATQMAHVFGIWIKDGVADPSRAKVGFGNARRGYDAAMTEIEKRQQQ
jgi:hypothetical protein